MTQVQPGQEFDVRGGVLVAQVELALDLTHKLQTVRIPSGIHQRELFYHCIAKKHCYQNF